MVILVTGATGFIGRRLVALLRARDRPVRCLVRPGSEAGSLEALGCELARGDMSDRESLEAACSDAESVVHLVAILRGRRRDFETVMEAGSRALLAAAVKAGARRFVLVSALGLNERTRELTPYYRAKWHEERAAADSGLDHVVFRPSFVFGAGGGVLPTFLKLVRYSPLTPVLGPGTELIQPIAVEDVAAHLALAADPAVAIPDGAGAGQRTFDLVGPDRVSWNELYELIARVLGKRRRRLHIPYSVARVQATLLERLPGFPFTRDQVAMLAAGDNIGEAEATRRAFGLPLASLDEQIRRAARGGPSTVVR